MAENKMLEIIQENNLSEVQAKPLLESFGDFFVSAHKLVAKAGGIKVTSEDQKDEMKKARELRLELRALRIEANKTRVTLKEGYLRGGNAVQSIYNDIEKIIKPEEDRLEQAEKFAEIKAAERRQARYEKRVAELSKYVSDTSIYHLIDMTDEVYDKLLADSKAAHEAKIEAEKKAEEERVAHEKREKTYRDRMMELAPFVKFQPRPINIDTDEREYQEILKASKLAAEKHEMEQEAIRKQAEVDRKARQEAERKLEEQQKKIAENQRIAREKLLAEQEAEAKAKAEADEKERQKLLAPDKTKLIEFAAVISTLQSPAVKSKEANDVLLQVEKSLQSISKYIHERAEKL